MKAKRKMMVDLWSLWLPKLLFCLPQWVEETLMIAFTFLELPHPVLLWLCICVTMLNTGECFYLHWNSCGLVWGPVYTQLPPDLSFYSSKYPLTLVSSFFFFVFLLHLQIVTSLSYWSLLYYEFTQHYHSCLKMISMGESWIYCFELNLLLNWIEGMKFHFYSSWFGSSELKEE